MTWQTLTPINLTQAGAYVPLPLAGAGGRVPLQIPPFSVGERGLYEVGIYDLPQGGPPGLVAAAQTAQIAAYTRSLVFEVPPSIAAPHVGLRLLSHADLETATYSVAVRWQPPYGSGTGTGGTQPVVGGLIMQASWGEIRDYLRAGLRDGLVSWADLASELGDLQDAIDSLAQSSATAQALAAIAARVTFLETGDDPALAAAIASIQAALNGLGGTYATDAELAAAIAPIHAAQTQLSTAIATETLARQQLATELAQDTLFLYAPGTYLIDCPNGYGIRGWIASGGGNGGTPPVGTQGGGSGSGGIFNFFDLSADYLASLKKLVSNLAVISSSQLQLIIPAVRTPATFNSALNLTLRWNHPSDSLKIISVPTPNGASGVTGGAFGGTRQQFLGGAGTNGGTATAGTSGGLQAFGAGGGSGGGHNNTIGFNGATGAAGFATGIGAFLWANFPLVAAPAGTFSPSSLNAPNYPDYLSPEAQSQASIYPLGGGGGAGNPSGVGGSGGHGAPGCGGGGGGAGSTGGGTGGNGGSGIVKLSLYKE